MEMRSGLLFSFRFCATFLKSGKASHIEMPDNHTDIKFPYPKLKLMIVHLPTFYLDENRIGFVMEIQENLFGLFLFMFVGFGSNSSI